MQHVELVTCDSCRYASDWDNEDFDVWLCKPKYFKFPIPMRRNEVREAGKLGQKIKSFRSP